VFENRMLRIFGPKRAKETGGWRKLQDEELHNLYTPADIIRVNKSSGRYGWDMRVLRMPTIFSRKI
jgi:hypothetical protein